jgi:hypothetical protein
MLPPAIPERVPLGPCLRLRNLALGLVGLAGVGCASANFDGKVYRNEEVAFRVGPVPSSWREIEVEGALIAFRDDSAETTVAVGGRCGKDADDVPLQSLTHHLFLHFTDRDVLSQKLVRLDGREALRTELEASLDGVAKRYTIYVLKKDGCVYDFMRIAAPNALGSKEHGFERFVAGFATLESS